jgi:hypothetical protein
VIANNNLLQLVGDEDALRVFSGNRHPRERGPRASILNGNQLPPLGSHSTHPSQDTEIFDAVHDAEG